MPHVKKKNIVVAREEVECDCLRFGVGDRYTMDAGRWCELELAVVVWVLGVGGFGECRDQYLMVIEGLGG